MGRAPLTAYEDGGWDLYLVTDENLSRGRSHLQIAVLAIEGGVDVIQLRDKEMPARELFQCALEIRSLTARKGVRFIVNDRLDIALAVGADGVHLGQDDLPSAVARSLAPDLVIGVSVGSVEEAVIAQREGADYVAVSPLFGTGSKKDAGPGHGLEVLREVRGSVTLPVVGIGGINIANVAEVVGAGADGVAVISALVSQPDVTKAAKELRAAVVEAKASRRRAMECMGP
jgi:thiamine-phosphate pyrophosphorylase